MQKTFKSPHAGPGKPRMELTPEEQQEIKDVYQLLKSIKPTCRRVKRSREVVCRVLGIETQKKPEPVKKNFFSWSNYGNSMIL
jgi:hypothetical protein